MLDAVTYLRNTGTHFPSGNVFLLTSLQVIGHGISSAVISLLCYFAIFSHVPVLNGCNEPCVISHTDVTAKAETSVVNVIGIHPIKTHLKGGNYYADKLLFSNCLHIAVNLTV